MKTITFDMEQCLSSFFVNSSVALPKGNYGTSIYVCDEEQGCYLVWHEAVAERVANDVSLCLHEFHIHHLKKEVEDFVVYSDAYNG
jgi:hypothetical protein